MLAQDKEKLMSRIGRQPIEVPAGVEVKVQGLEVLVSGPKGKLKRTIDPRISVKLEDKKVILTRQGEDKATRALHGLYRALINNMVTGVKDGFSKNLELSGVGYRAAKEGKKLVMTLGFSHPVNFDPPEGIEFTVEGQNKVKVAGIDRELVGQIAANIRAARPVEPYKGKGIKYEGEVVRRKAGKAAKAAGGAAA
jgi:large subunit ribosomal protein L6